MAGLSTGIENQVGLVHLLLLEVSSLHRLGERGLVIPFVLAIGFLLHHVGARLTLSFLSSVLSPSLLLNIKRRYQIFNRYLPSLVFESCGEVPLGSTTTELAIGEGTTAAGTDFDTRQLKVDAGRKLTRDGYADSGSGQMIGTRDNLVGPGCSRVQRVAAAGGPRHTRRMRMYLSRAHWLARCHYIWVPEANIGKVNGSGP